MTLRHRLTALLLVALLLAACGSASSATTPPSSSPSVAPAGITTPEAAAARVGEENPSLAGIGPRNPDVIGACCFWTATPTADGFRVEFEVGWGDCPAGCIDRHHWTYTVTSDGRVELVAESGPPVPSGIPGEAGGAGGDIGGGILPGGSGITGRALAGPTCPVVTPGDPACDDRPLAGVIVLVLDANGTEIARLQTDAEGRYTVTLPPGPYTVEPQPVKGIMGTPAPLQVAVAGAFATVDLDYDTGIR